MFISIIVFLLYFKQLTVISIKHVSPYACKVSRSISRSIIVPFIAIVLLLLEIDDSKFIGKFDITRLTCTAF